MKKTVLQSAVMALVMAAGAAQAADSAVIERGQAVYNLPSNAKLRRGSMDPGVYVRVSSESMNVLMRGSAHDV